MDNNITHDNRAVIDDIEQRRESTFWMLSHISQQWLKIPFRQQVQLLEIEKLIRWEGVQIALNDPEFSVPSHTHNGASMSHAAVLTGMGRADISKIHKMGKAPAEPSGDDTHRLIQVLTAWSSETDYLDDDGRPIDLPLTGKPPSLHALNHRVGRQVPDRALADSLVKNGNAEWITDPETQKQGKMLRWKKGTADAEHFSARDNILKTQIASDFLYSLQQACNRKCQPQPRLLEAYYNDIDAEKVEEARNLLILKMERFNRECAVELAKYRAKADKPTVRLGVGSYTFMSAPYLIDKAPDRANTH